MFVTKIKDVPAVVLVVGLALAGAAGQIYRTQAAEQPKAKEEQPAANKDQKQAKEKQPKEAKKEQKVLTPEEAIKQVPKRM